MHAAGEHDALEALQVGKETACVLRKQLKLVPQQVQVVWDVLLWVAAMRSKICSQDAITDLLQVCTLPPVATSLHTALGEVFLVGLHRIILSTVSLPLGFLKCIAQLRVQSIRLD